MRKMNPTFVFIVFVLGCSCSVSGMVCPPNVCEDTECEQVDETVCSGPEKTIRKGGFCGCCDTCFTIVDVGEYCGFPLYGLPPTTILCKEGLSCTGGFCLPKNEINVF